VIPHGLYDLKLNTGYITLGTGHDTSEFACDCLFSWWQDHGKNNYPNASSILLLCDCGGSNNVRHYIFKENLQHLVDKIGIEIRIAHYPPYTSKYNPIEHLLFPHISRVCRGVIFQNKEMVRDFMRKANTKNGLQVFVSVTDKIYKPKQQLTQDYKKNMTVIFDEYLPEWNYTVVHKNSQLFPFHSFTSIRDNIYQTQVSLQRTIQALKLDFSQMELFPANAGRRKSNK
jgi:hypothetical protein